MTSGAVPQPARPPPSGRRRIARAALFSLGALVLGYLAAALLVTNRARTAKASMEGHLVEASKRARAEAGVFKKAPRPGQPLSHACARIAPVRADEILQYLTPPDGWDEDEVSLIDYDQFVGARAGRFAETSAVDSPHLRGFVPQLISVITEYPFDWGRFSDSRFAWHYPPVERAKYLIIALPTQIGRPSLGSGGFVGGRTLMHVRVLDMQTAQTVCEGKLEDSVPRSFEAHGEGKSDADAQADAVENADDYLELAHANAVNVLPLHHLCNLGGSELCRLTSDQLGVPREPTTP